MYINVTDNTEVDTIINHLLFMDGIMFLYHSHKD